MIKQVVSLSLMGMVCLPDLAGAGGRGARVCPEPPLLVQCPPLLMIAPQCFPPSELVLPPAPPMKKPSVTAEPEVKPTPPRSALETPAAEPKVAVPEPERIRPVGGLDLPAKPPTAPVPEVKPAASPDLPKLPLLIPKLPSGDSGLPPLAVPTPADPSGKVNANYPPAPARVRIVPVVAEEKNLVTESSLRTIGFFNRSRTDLTLTVNGKSTAFPKQSYLSLDLPRKFTWKLDDALEQTTEVPLDAPGVEIIVRY